MPRTRLNKVPSEDDSHCDCNSQWKTLFEAQNENLRELIETLHTPSTNALLNDNLLPEFNPERTDSDALSWCNTAALCLQDESMQGGKLIATLSKALKGSASSWLAQASYAGITWIEFKALFLDRFATIETQSSTLINMFRESIHEDENYGTYANRQVNHLLNRWNATSMEQVAISIVMAILAQKDSRLHHLACTTEIKTRQQLQQELQAFSYLKRKADNIKTVPEKRLKIADRKCYGCGKIGHKIQECRKEKSRQPISRNTYIRVKREKAVKTKPTCFKCGLGGHIAPRCKTETSGRSETSSAAPYEVVKNTLKGMKTLKEEKDAPELGCDAKPYSISETV